MAHESDAPVVSEVTRQAITRVEGLIKKGERVLATNRPPPSNTFGFPNTVDTQLFAEWRSQSLTCLTSCFPDDHPYVRSFESACEKGHTSDARAGHGILQAVLEDLKAGYLSTLAEIVHANTFADFLEMADHLLDDGGYKDAAAVMAGSTLEAHLRNLCEKNGIDVERETRDGVAPKKVDALNADLAREGIYTKLDQKSVTAWLDLRNNAAHGHYDQYSADQVALLIQGVRDFIARHPA